MEHWSSCEVHNEPATKAGSCNCGGFTIAQRLLETFYRFAYNLFALMGMFHLIRIRKIYRLDDNCPTPASLLYRVGHLFGTQQAYQHCLKTARKYGAEQS